MCLRQCHAHVNHPVSVSSDNNSMSIFILIDNLLVKYANAKGVQKCENSIGPGA